MHVVIIDGDVSYPATSGKRLRTLNLMPRSRNAIASRTGPRQKRARGVAPPFLRGSGVLTVLVHHPVPHKSGLAFTRDCSPIFFFATVLRDAHHCEPMHEAVSSLARSDKIDVWQMECALSINRGCDVASARRHRTMLTH